MRVLPALALALPLCAAAQPLPIFDAHLHYSHDAWETVPVAQAIDIMRKAGLKRALISSSGDEGQQRLYRAAPDLVIPELRPYRTRGEIGTWFRDETLIAYLEERLSKYRYAGIGEFHLYGADADLPVPRRMVQLARRHGLFLHAHSDADAVERLFRQWPQARILWAHAGFERPERVAEMLRKHRNLWADLAFRTDHASDPAWREAFLKFPDRFMVGTDTFTPERWHYIPEHAEWSRRWLAELPRDVAERIAWKNGEAVFGSLLQRPD
jgi:predicted TIM-barrel fold metal-dependent hydrolase